MFLFVSCRNNVSNNVSDRDSTTHRIALHVMCVQCNSGEGVEGGGGEEGAGIEVSESWLDDILLTASLGGDLARAGGWGLNWGRMLVQGLAQGLGFPRWRARGHWGRVPGEIRSAQVLDFQCRVQWREIEGKAIVI